MARGRSSAGNRQTGRAILSTIASDPLSALLRPLPVVSSGHLLDVEDGRLWHPDPEHGALTIGGRNAHIVVHNRPIIARSKPIWAWKGLPVGVQVPVGVRFESPLKVITCVRRKVRREVIFALDKLRGGKGRGAGKHHPRRTWRSDIRC